jgi:hypothetical protein
MPSNISMTHQCPIVMHNRELPTGEIKIKSMQLLYDEVTNEPQGAVTVGLCVVAEFGAASFIPHVN